MRLCVFIPVLLSHVGVNGFQVSNTLLASSKASSTVLYRAFHKKNKQAELLKKLNKAKEEREKKRNYQ